MTRILAWLGLLALSLGAYASGNTLLRGALPVAVTVAIAGVFACTLQRGRTPLIARAIAAVDGSQWLADPAVARYARQLTRLWAVYLMLWAIVAAVAAWTAAPAVSRIGTFGVPLAVAALFVGEFVLRRWLLPQAPRRGFMAFTLRLIRSWPALLVDRESPGARGHGDTGHVP
ncbi:MAG: hypothetical protein DYH18_03975 [Xanthomonadales bacterium PRO7]|nr:hypothetical protein [Xanthomonadales bacterium PRO7]HMM57962.1 hypothetical protein [Rudaea sp.]